MASKSSLNVTLPHELNSLEPIEVVDHSILMHAIFVGRHAINHIGESWKRIGLCGVYILLSNLDENGRFDAYVGFTSTGYMRRLFDHNKSKSYWTQVILFSRLDNPTLTSTQSRWLEGDIVRILRSAEHINVRNEAWTGDKTIPDHELELAESVSLFIMRVLSLRGYNTASLEDVVKPLERKISQLPALPLKLPVISAQKSSNALPLPVMLPQMSRNDVINEVPVIALPIHQINPLLEVNKSDLVADDLGKTLEKWRYRMYKEYNIHQQHYVFTASVLEAIVAVEPHTKADLIKISGIGKIKLDQFGDSLLATLNLFYAQRDKAFGSE